MMGVIYIILGILFGKELSEGFFLMEPYPGRDGKQNQNLLWLIFPAAFGTGILMFGWVTYMVAWAASAAGAVQPLFYGNIAVLGSSAVFLLLLYLRRLRRKQKIFPVISRMPSGSRKIFIKEAVFFGLLFIFLVWIMFYVFYIKDDILYSGFTVYGDYAPHTAMMRSFSRGNNFPTQYPHFGGEDIKYHFMFQFLVGNLEYLGLRIDLAYNLVSVLSLLGFLMVLYSLAKRITGSGKAGFLTVLFFFFRSSFTFFRFLWEHFRDGDLWQVLRDNTSFIGYTPNESWGLWNFNVYLNQRHLAFGLLLVSLALWLYLERAETGCAIQGRGTGWIRSLFFTRESWKLCCPEKSLAVGLVLGLAVFWNGAAVIGGLLILMGFAIFSDGKLDYVLTAGVTVFLSVLQTRIFMYDSVVGISFYWGFIAEDKSIGGVLWYLVQMSGIFFVGALILALFLRSRLQRAILVSFLFPLVFSFCISMTPDITVNHKYIMISCAFLAIFWAQAIVALFAGKKKRLLLRILAAVLTACLTATGIYDFVIILRNNGEGHRVTVFMDSPLTDWLSENLSHTDLILTPEYSMNEVTMSGVMMYLGWPYYAWSAGYDTYGRAEKAVEIYTSADKELVSRLVKQEKITYILYEEGMEFEGETCREDTISELYPLVFQSEDGRIRIYET